MVFACAFTEVSRAAVQCSVITMSLFTAFVRSLSAVWSHCQALGWRGLLPDERAFVLTFFGLQQGSWLIANVRVGLRRLGDTRRALSFNGGRLSFPKPMYEGGDPKGGLRLEHPLVAGLFAHELLHALQRRQGVAVSRQALLLQWRWLVRRENPYLYSDCSSATALLRQFWLANVEQQGQMWQDYVQSVVGGKPLTSHALLSIAVQRGRLRRRQTGNMKQ